MFENEIAIDEVSETHELESRNEPPAPLWASLLTAQEPKPEAQQEPDETEAANVAANDSLAEETCESEDMAAMEKEPAEKSKPTDLSHAEVIPGERGKQTDKKADAVTKFDLLEAAQQDNELPKTQSKASCVDEDLNAKPRVKRSARSAFYTTPEIMESLKEEASKQGVSRSQLVEEAVILYLSL